MGSKFKPRQQNVPRNAIVEDMFRTRKGDSMRHRNDRRLKEKEKSLPEDWDEDFSPDSE